VTDLLKGTWIGGAWRATAATRQVRDKFSGDIVAELTESGLSDVEDAIEGAYRASQKVLTPLARHDILMRLVDIFVERKQKILDDYVLETGFTYSDAEGEFSRTLNIYRLSAHEALRIAGEEVPLGATAGSDNRLAFTIRTPVGVVVAIAPFNAPLSTVAHKIGPAIAAGNAVILKPAESTPLSSINAVEAFHDAGLPPGYLQMVHGSGSGLSPALLGNDRVRFYTFTGSTSIGRVISEKAGLARTHLELGSNSASIVAKDADLHLVAELVGRAGFRKAGQVCTSVQRILVDRAVASELRDVLGARVAKMVAGNPKDKGSDIGPLISQKEAERAEAWVAEAKKAGADVIGGQRNGPVLSPTLLSRVPADAKVINEEIFAPVVSLVDIDSVDQGIELINSGRYGLQSGVFTQDIDLAFDAARRIEVGGVIINDTSSYHADAMPYGGVKDSGHGVEGPRYAVEDMTVPRIIVMNLRPPRI
jgi:acyl-CoA reductase-like NAD-dependent aldehyde dehydrogenase